MSNASAIDCQSLCMTFAGQVHAVQNVSLQFPAGQIVSLIGPSGCGKTTLLRLLAGLEQPTEGQVKLEPNAYGKNGELAFVFQQPNLLPWRTALENVTLPLELIGKGGADAEAKAMQILQSVKLSDAMDRTPRQLSGGMKMRVSIARAIVTNPKVLFLDEPFAALDDMLRADLGELLLELWDERKFTAVMVTHNIAESIMLSHQIIVMQDGSAKEVIENPFSFPRDSSLRRSAEFASFFGDVMDSLRGNA